MKDSLDKVIEIVKILIKNEFYGTLVIRFENGKAVHLKKEESIKL